MMALFNCRWVSFMGLSVAVCLAIMSSTCQHKPMGLADTSPQNAGYFYHASPVSGLKVLEPRVSTHGKSYVYAAPHRGFVATFLAPWDDFDFELGTCTNEFGRVHLVERYPNAFQTIYQGARGSLYRVPPQGFFVGTGNPLEVVTPHATPVLGEEVVANALVYLKGLEKSGELDIYLFPTRPPCVPGDDSDLLEKAVRWYKNSGPVKKMSLFETFRNKHPHLRREFEKAIAD